MTLPTTRIDTLSPARRVHGENSQSVHNNSNDPQNILLVDFVPNGATNSHAEIANNVITGNRYINNYPVIVQQQQQHALQNNHVNHNNNDLSNFTLVNLTNQPETGDNDDESTQLFVKSHVTLQRGSISGGGAEPIPNYSTGAHNKLSSSLSSSSGDSDTGFLVPQNGVKGRSLGKDRQYRLPMQNSLPSTSYPGSPTYNSAVQLAHRKRLRRRRSSGRRKPVQIEHSESNDLFSLCCCFGDDNSNVHDPRNQNSTSLTSKYLRYSCFIILIIAIATFASIMVSLQRKVDSLSWEVSKMSATTTSAGNLDSTPKTINTSKDNRNPSPSLQDLVIKQQQLNASFTSLKSLLDDLTQTVSNLQKQPSVEEVRKDLARLGSDLEGSIKELQKDVEILKNSPTVDKSSEAINGDAKEKQDSSSDLAVTSPTVAS